MDSVIDEGDILNKLAAEAIFPVSAAAIKYFICRRVISIPNNLFFFPINFPYRIETTLRAL
jgi:hypothetical protein